jgi:hypothetical protein
LQAARKRAERRRKTTVWVVVVVLILAVGGIIGGIAASSSGGKKPAPSAGPGPMGPEGINLEEGTPLASLTAAAKGSTVEGVECNTQEQVKYHIHTHLAVYVDGKLRPITPGIGIVQPQGQQTPNGDFFQATNCYYWLHVHAQDGVIHIESPTTRTYTLGQFFAIWGQPLTKNRVGPAAGTVTAFVNGKPYTGDPASIALGSREDVQIDVGTPVPFQKVDWSKSQL